MLFPTIDFAIFFLIVFSGSWLLRPHPVPWRLFILASSIYFYGYWDWRLVPLLLGTVVVNWAFGRAVHTALGPDATKTARSRTLVALAVVVDLGVLGWFKYAGFFADSVAERLGDLGFHVGQPTLSIVLPIGISFFTFQAISYVIDIGRGVWTRPVPAAGLRRLPDVLRPPGGRTHRPGQRVHPPARLAARPPLCALLGSLHVDLPGLVQEGGHLQLHGHRGRPGVQPAGPAQPLGRAVGDLGLRHPDLRRLLRLHRHRHRHRPAARHPLPAELRCSLPVVVVPGLLAALAHDPVEVAAGLPLHPPRRQPRQRRLHVSQPHVDHGHRRPVARRQLDLRDLGLHPGQRPGGRAGHQGALGPPTRADGTAHLAGARPAVAGDLPGGVPGLGVLPGAELLRRHGRAGAAVPRRWLLQPGHPAADVHHRGHAGVPVRRRPGCPSESPRPSRHLAPALQVVALGVGLVLVDALGPAGIAPFIYFQF